MQDSAISALKEVKNLFREIGYTLSDAEDIFMYVLDITLEELILGNHQLTDAQKINIQEIIARAVNGEPMAHIMGQKFFWDSYFKVTKDTLIPRAETEILVAAVLKKINERRGGKSQGIKLLDLGTGSGCILLSIVKELKKNCYNFSGIGIDISTHAIDIAKYNAKNLELDDNVQFICCNWNELLERFPDEKFDVIVSNPPYIPSNDIPQLNLSVRNFEPHTALDGSDDGLECYREIIAILKRMDIGDSIIAFEFGIRQSQSIELMMSEIGSFEILKDFRNIPRIIISK